VRRFLDASVLCRYLLNDVPDQSGRARRLIASGQEFWLDPVALLETAQVMHYHYRISARDTAFGLIALIREPQARLNGLDYYHTVQALLFCAHDRADFGDALLWVAARTDPAGEVYTFDRGFPSERVSIREP
jgi:predicted nucleic-acid-binding protein